MNNFLEKVNFKSENSKHEQLCLFGLQILQLRMMYLTQLTPSWNTGSSGHSPQNLVRNKLNQKVTSPTSVRKWWRFRIASWCFSFFSSGSTPPGRSAWSLLVVTRKCKHQVIGGNISQKEVYASHSTSTLLLSVGGVSCFGHPQIFQVCVRHPCHSQWSLP